MRFLLAWLIFSGVAFAELIPAIRLVDWTPGTATGVLDSETGFSRTGAGTRTMYVNAKTGALGAGGMYGGTLAAGDGSTDDTVALQAMINTCPANKYIYLPASTYRTTATLYFNPSAGLGTNDIGMRGDGDTSIISTSATTAIQIGPRNGFVLPGSASVSDMVVSAGLTKGSTSLTIGNTSQLTVGQLINIQAQNDPGPPDVNTSAFLYGGQGQVVTVATKPDSTHITISPALYGAWGAGVVPVRIRAVAYQISGIGLESFKVDLTPSSDGQTAFSLNQGINCWFKSVRAKACKNYGFTLADSLNCEVRHSTVDDRNGGGTSGAAIHLSNSSGCLIEDNIIFGEWITTIMGNDGMSGNAISRNVDDSSNLLDTNHTSGPYYNLYEGNVRINGPIISDGYFGSERYLTVFNNYSVGVSMHRFTRDSNDVGNIKTSSADVTGYPNFANLGYTGTSTYYSGDYSDPWDDYGITGTRVTVTQGTASGYTVNGAHIIGDTTIAVTGGTGTLGLGDKVTFSGSSYTYYVQDFAGGIITINDGQAQYTGSPGLREAISNGATVTVTSIAPGTASGYVINHGGGYIVGDTVLTVGTGTGTMKPGEIVTFAGGGAYRYFVTSLVGTTLTIGAASAGADPGLQTVIANGAAITVTRDDALFSYSGGTMRSFNGFYPKYPILSWGGTGDTHQRFRVPVANSTHFVVTTDAYSPTTPNTTDLPAIGTNLDSVGMGTEGYQERDLAVALTRVQKGNRYLDDGHFDSLGGDPLPESLMYSSKPPWLIAAETELSTTFNLQAFDPVTPTPPSASNIPAGARLYLLIDPAFVSASINAAGTQLTLAFNKPMTHGAGGNGGVTLSGGITATFSGFSGSTANYTLSRTISEGEVVLASYAQPTNGLEATSNGNDLSSFTDQTVTNSSSVTTGVVHYGPDVVDMTSDYGYVDSSIILFGKAVTGSSSGNMLAVRWYTAGNVYSVPVRAVVCETDGTVVAKSSSNGTVTGFDRWQSIPISSATMQANHTYLAGVQFLGGSGDPLLRALTGQGANAGYNAQGFLPFGTALPSVGGVISGISGDTFQVAIQLRAVLDKRTSHSGSGRTTRSGSGRTTRQ